MVKLNEKKGETLIETLAAILIFTMGSIALCTMITSATRLNLQVRDKDRAVQQQLVQAETAREISGTGTVSITLEGVTLDSFPVNVYGGDPAEDGSTSLYTYLPQP